MEIWKDVQNFVGKYQVSNCGRVRSLPRVIDNGKGWRKPYPGVVLKPKEMKTGYQQVTLGRHKYATIHRLVAQAFLENPNGFREVNHKDGVKTNNHVENLEWCSRHLNIRHAMKNGLYDEARKSQAKAVGGVQNYLAKLNDSRVKEIRQKHKQGFGLTMLAKEYGVTIWTIRDVVNNKSWRHVLS